MQRWRIIHTLFMHWFSIDEVATKEWLLILKKINVDTFFKVI